MEDFMFLFIVAVPALFLGFFKKTLWWFPGLFVFGLAVTVGTMSNHHEVHGDIPVMRIDSESLKNFEVLALFVLGAILLAVGANASGKASDQRPQPSPLPVATAMARDDKPN